MNQMYIALATDPKGKLYGMWEMSGIVKVYGWHPSKVSVFAADKDSDFTKLHKPHGDKARSKFQEAWKNAIGHTKWYKCDLIAYKKHPKDENITEKDLQGRKTALRKTFSNPASRRYALYGRTLQEYLWHGVVHFMMRFGKEFRRRGWTFRAYRIGSKDCPVEVDIPKGMAFKTFTYKPFKSAEASFRIKEKKSE